MPTIDDLSQIRKSTKSGKNPSLAGAVRAECVHCWPDTCLSDFFRISWIFGFGKDGGEGEIRTHEALTSLPVFKTGALDHSATSPQKGSV
jgi:hypothetical protein